MENEKGRIDILKDEMLFALVEILEQDVKMTIKKEEILKMLPKVYNDLSVEKIIKILPYDSYLALEEIIKYVKDNSNTEDVTKKIISFYDKKDKGVKYLIDLMIVVLRVKKGKHTYYVDLEVLKALEKIYTDENRKKVEEYEKLEKIILGILYTYGVVENKYFLKTISRCMGKIIPENEILKFVFTRINLSKIVKYEYLEWENNTVDEFITYLSSNNTFDNGFEPSRNDVINIAVEQKIRGLNYKKYTKDEYIAQAKSILGKREKDFLEYINQYEIIPNFIFELILVKIKSAVDVNEWFMPILEEMEKDKVSEFLDKYKKFYNNLPSYVLCGYSPNEYSKNIKN